MKIYFSYPSRGVDDFADHYSAIEKATSNLGHTCFCYPSSQLEEGQNEKEKMEIQQQQYQKMVKSLKASDLVVLEISVNSLSMGYLMHRALDMGKPVVALFSQKSVSPFTYGINNDKLQVLDYTQDEVTDVLEAAFEYAQSQQDTRFNFFISPKHQNYLDWVAKKHRVPRSVHLRNLIERDIDGNDDYTS